VLRAAQSAVTLLHLNTRRVVYVEVVDASYPDPALSNNRVSLRKWSMGDLDCVAMASSDPRIPAGTAVPAEFSSDTVRAFIERQWSRVDEGEGVSLAIHARDADLAVGLVVISLRPQPGVVGLGYWIVPTARRSGYATSAVELASSWAMRSAGFARIEAWVEPKNVDSMGVLESVGFEREGRLRSLLTIGSARSDALVYARVSK